MKLFLLQRRDMMASFIAIKMMSSALLSRLMIWGKSLVVLTGGGGWVVIKLAPSFLSLAVFFHSRVVRTWKWNYGCLSVWWWHHVYIVLSDNHRVLRDVESVRQEATLLREQMQIVKEDIKKVSLVTYPRLLVPVQLFITFSAFLSWEAKTNFHTWG